MYSVVIVDDEELIRKGLARLIEMSGTGFEVAGEAANGRDGYELAMKVMPQVVIADVRMPVMDGLEMIDQIRQSARSVRCIVLSAYSDYGYTRHAIRAGVVDYLVKPVNRLELYALLESIKKEMEEEAPPQEETAGEIPGTGEHPGHGRGSVVEAAVDYIRKNYFNDISLEQVAGQVHMNSNYFSSLFKREMGVNFIDYLTGLRMEKSRQLLETSELKVFEIAQIVGNYSPKHYTRLFKELHGMSPVEYRAKHVKNHHPK